MKKKMTYVAPETEQMVISFEEHFLDGSVGVVGANSIDGWDSDNEAW